MTQTTNYKELLREAIRNNKKTSLLVEDAGLTPNDVENTFFNIWGPITDDRVYALECLTELEEVIDHNTKLAKEVFDELFLVASDCISVANDTLNEPVGGDVRWRRKGDYLDTKNKKLIKDPTTESVSQSQASRAFRMYADMMEPLAKQIKCRDNAMSALGHYGNIDKIAETPGLFNDVNTLVTASFGADSAGTASLVKIYGRIFSYLTPVK